MSKIITRAALAAVMFAICASAGAADDPEDRQPAEATPEQSWYANQPSNYQLNARQIVQQKAMTRSALRQARLSSMSWYGMCNSRPMATATPFMSLYSPTWQMPGGRPFGWFTGERPVYVFWDR